MTEPKDLKVEFAPGCFDNFEGTQEELQEMIAMLHQMVADGTLDENATPVDPDDEEFVKMLQDRMKPRQ